MAAMTRRERFERALRHEEVDRLPFWVKIFSPSYLDFQDERYRNMGELALADFLDLDHMGWGDSPVAGVNDRVEQTAEQQEGLRTVRFKTPDGVLTMAERFAKSSISWHPAEFPIKTAADLRAARHLFEGTRFTLDDDRLDRAKERIRAVGDRGIVLVAVGISPLMNLIQHLLGPEQTYLFLADYPAEMDELIGVMHEERLRYLRCLLANCPYVYLMSVENTSTTLLSPEVFARTCWRHLADYGRLIREAGRCHILHMCGKLKALLPRIDELPAVAIEAFTAPPLGDATLADRAALCPSKAVIGGTQATLWLRPAEEICAAIERSIAEAGGFRGVVLTSAGVMPPACSIPKIRQVRELVRRIAAK